MDSGNWLRRLLIILLFLPLLLLLFTPWGRTWGLTPILFLLLAVINFILLIWLFRRAAAAAQAQLPKPKMIHPDEQPDVIKEVMEVCVATHEDGIRIFRGPLRESPEQAFEKLKAAFPEDIVPLLQQDERLDTSIILMDKPIEQATLETPVRPALHWLLFFLTLLTTTWAGAMYQGIDLFQEPARFTAGIPYAIGLLAILGCHEMGHYFAAKHHKMNVTPPYFIPVPFALGTFGAFIRMRTPPEERTSLFDMAIAGPLAGLVIALPALVLGLQTSEIVSRPIEAEGFIFSALPANSFLFGLLARISFAGELNPGDLVRLSPLGFAGWLGLLITALNLVPVGQLDGGHIARAMFGTRTGLTISRLAMWTIFLLALFVWPWLLLWALIIFMIARRITPPLNDLTPVSGWRRGLGFFTFVILLMILTPLPDAAWARMSMHFPWF
ncbi:MAG: site-2 protease family protein [Verrucomicrobia bacterium]|nr:site-2 protease family protein [Verrucomicrobiota bacterium]